MIINIIIIIIIITIIIITITILIMTFFVQHAHAANILKAYSRPTVSNWYTNRKLTTGPSRAPSRSSLKLTGSQKSLADPQGLTRPGFSIYLAVDSVYFS